MTPVPIAIDVLAASAGVVYLVEGATAEESEFFGDSLNDAFLVSGALILATYGMSALVGVRNLCPASKSQPAPSRMNWR